MLAAMLDAMLAAMVKVQRFPGESILARWVIDGAALQGFLREMQLRSKSFSTMPKDLLQECAKRASGAGLEVVVREDAVFVGEWGSPNWFAEVQVHDTWIHFLGEEGYHVPVPLAPGARADAERIAARYAEIYEQGRREAQRWFEEERARPTWSSRFLRFAEAHFVWLALGACFVLIPIVVLLLGFWNGSFFD